MGFVHHTVYLRRDMPLGDPSMAFLIRAAVRAALDAENVYVPCRVEIRVTDDETIRELNREHRGIDRATDVLSFPLQELVPGAFEIEPEELDPVTGVLWLGDMILSMERIRAQAAEYGHSVAREAAYLTVHSVLHLLGYDHVDEGEMKKAMRAREDAILDAMGITRE